MKKPRQRATRRVITQRLLAEPSHGAAGPAVSLITGEVFPTTETKPIKRDMTRIRALRRIGKLQRTKHQSFKTIESAFPKEDQS